MHNIVITELRSFLSQYKDIVSIKPEESYKLVTISNKGIINLRNIVQGVEIKGDTAYRVKSGSFIYSRLAAHTGSFGLVPRELDGAIVTSEMPVFEINQDIILSDYLLHLLRQKKFLNILVQLTKGMGRVRIKEDSFLNIKLPIHNDVVDQKRVIESLNSKFENIEALDNKYSEQIGIIAQTRQALLQEAIEGKLTANWRLEHSELIKGDNHASKLLEKIKSERARLVEEGKVRKEKPLLPISGDKNPFELPDGWVWCRFGDYAFFERGKFSIRPRNDKSCFGGRYPFIQIHSLSNNGDVIKEYSQTLNDKGFSVSKQFEKGTIAVAIVGGTIGNLGILGLDMCFPDSMIGIRPMPNVNQDYVLLLLKSKQVVIRKAAYQMAGQPNIKLPTLSELVIALPPLPEQQAIVDRMESLLSMIEELEKQVLERNEQSEMLKQSVLREAFANSD
jgi:type I restriction enzyme S subunit